MAASKPAPGDLELVREFVNTKDVDEGTDAFATATELSSWLRDRDLLPADGDALSERDRELAVTLREALRTMMLANNDGRPVAEDTVRDLRSVAADTVIAVQVDPSGGLSLDAADHGGRAALSRLLLIVQRAMEEGTWSRLKACRDDTCQWGFYDHSKNHSRAWCSMDVCGARNKAREYRRRQAGHDDHE